MGEWATRLIQYLPSPLCYICHLYTHTHSYFLAELRDPESSSWILSRGCWTKSVRIYKLILCWWESRWRSTSGMLLQTFPRLNFSKGTLVACIVTWWFSRYCSFFSSCYYDHQFVFMWPTSCQMTTKTLEVEIQLPSVRGGQTVLAALCSSHGYL